MSGMIDARLRQLGIELPEPAAPVANYVPFGVSGNLVFIAGQICQWNGERRFIGKLGAGIGSRRRGSALSTSWPICASPAATISTACAAVSGSAALSTAPPNSPTCRRSSTAPPT